MMKDDPAIECIREVRHVISGKFGHDPKKLVEYYIELQKKHKERTITLSDVREASEKLLVKA